MLPQEAGSVSAVVSNTGPVTRVRGRVVQDNQFMQNAQLGGFCC